MAVWKHHSDPTPNVTFRVQQYLQRKLIGLFGSAFAEDFGMFSKTFLQEVDDGKRWTDLLQEVCLDISAIFLWWVSFIRVHSPAVIKMH